VQEREEKKKGVWDFHGGEEGARSKKRQEVHSLHTHTHINQGGGGRERVGGGREARLVPLPLRRLISSRFKVKERQKSRSSKVIMTNCIEMFSSSRKNKKLRGTHLNFRSRGGGTRQLTNFKLNWQQRWAFFFHGRAAGAGRDSHIIVPTRAPVDHKPRFFLLHLRIPGVRDGHYGQRAGGGFRVFDRVLVGVCRGHCGECMPIYIYIHSYMHACIYTYMHTYIRTYIHTRMHAHVHTCITCSHTAYRYT
jgi:hypothetical protein